MPTPQKNTVEDLAIPTAKLRVFIELRSGDPSDQVTAGLKSARTNEPARTDI
jgi:hypothetical protein